LKPLLRVVRGSRKARRKACGGGGRRRHRLGVLLSAEKSRSAPAQRCRVRYREEAHRCAERFPLGVSLTTPRHGMRPRCATCSNGQTLLFSYEGWATESEFMSGCSTNWGAYLNSLKAGAEGRGFGPYPASATKPRSGVTAARTSAPCRAAHRGTRPRALAALRNGDRRRARVLDEAGHTSRSVECRRSHFEAGRAPSWRSLGELPHSPTHLRDDALSPRVEREASPDVARSPLARLHLLPDDLPDPGFLDALTRKDAVESPLPRESERSNSFPVRRLSKII
jgi:hypothetical protein